MPHSGQTLTRCLGSDFFLPNSLFKKSISISGSVGEAVTGSFEDVAAFL